MRFLALATDYDGTLADDGKITPGTYKVLRRFKDSGRKVVLVTGRDLGDLLEVVAEIDVFDLVVAENGALLYDPARKEEKLLAPCADERFVEALRRQGVKPLHVGKSIVATREPHEADVLATIRELGLELQVVFNKGAVMVLPAGVNKSSGLEAALGRLALSAENVVAVGDAENDHALLGRAGFGVAVFNALPSLREEADWVTSGSAGVGVVELMERIMKDDLRGFEADSKRHRVSIGNDERGKKFRIDPITTSALITGPSGSGKTSVTTAILERIAGKGFQFCVIDPEGDYDRFPESIKLGDPDHPPAPDEVMRLLERFQNPVVNLLGVRPTDRPRFFGALLGRIQDLRIRTGRPHFVLLDETHHLFPSEWRPAPLALPTVFEGVAMVTVDPDAVSAEALSKVNLVIAVGADPETVLRRFAKATGRKPPKAPKTSKRKLDVVAWACSAGGEGQRDPVRVRLKPGSADHDRHQRKYAKGDMEEDAFYFRGPKGELKLKAHNLAFFCQIAEGIDDATWTYHLGRSDYSRWVRRAIQDKRLAERIERIESAGHSPEESRARIIDAITKAYTAAA